MISQEQIDKMYAELDAYEKEIADHNENILKTLGEKAQNDFEELLDGCNINGKIHLVDAPKGIDQKENCGVYKKVHVEQWCTNMEGDSFAGFIYAKIKGLWIQVPFSC